MVLVAVWDDPFMKICRWQNVGEWQVAAQDTALWLRHGCAKFQLFS